MRISCDIFFHILQKGSSAQYFIKMINVFNSIAFQLHAQKQ